MKKQYSVRSSKDFNKILKSKGIKHSSKYLMMNSVKADEFKVGISIPKKLANAVVRNKNKRQIKNILHSLNPYSNNMHVIIVAKKEWLDLSFEEKEKTLTKDFNKLINKHV